MTEAALLCQIPVSALRERGYFAYVEGDTEVLAIDTAEGIRVYSGVCPHLGGPLLEGEICRREIVCPWHGFAFDAITGACKTIPGKAVWRNVTESETPEKPFSKSLLALPFEIKDGQLFVYARAMRP